MVRNLGTAVMTMVTTIVLSYLTDGTDSGRTMEAGS